jgi:hypothetical protein
VRLSSIPVLVVSAHPAGADQQTYRNVIGCLKAPYEAEELLAVVNASFTPPGHAGPQPS